MRRNRKASERDFAAAVGKALIDFAETGERTRLKRKLHMAQLNHWQPMKKRKRR